jgi:hypothetical protein
MSRALRTITIATVLVGVLDILAAFAVSAARGGQPLRVLQAIASGIFGPAAFRGGMPMAAAGLALHFVIALGVAAVYYGLSRRWPVLIQHPIWSGCVYGIAVRQFMNMVVVPLSRANFKAPSWDSVVIMIVIHMLFVGLPVALVVRADALRNRSAAGQAAAVA